MPLQVLFMRQTFLRAEISLRDFYLCRNRSSRLDTNIQTRGIGQNRGNKTKFLEAIALIIPCPGKCQWAHGKSRWSD